MRLIRASEIGEYLYCRRAWWLRQVLGLASVNVREMAAGTAAHAAHGQRVGMATLMRWAAIALVALAMAWVLLNWGGK